MVDVVVPGQVVNIPLPSFGDVLFSWSDQLVFWTLGCCPGFAQETGHVSQRDHGMDLQSFNRLQSISEAYTLVYALQTPTR